MKFLKISILIPVLFTFIAIAAKPVLTIITSAYWSTSMKSISNDCTMIVGLIKNSSLKPQQDVAINLSFNVDGKIEKSLLPGFTEVKIINPGESSPFKVNVFRKEKCLPYTLNATSKPAKQLGGRALHIIESSGQYYAQVFRILGKVKNVTSKTIHDTQVICTAFADKNKKILVGSDKDFPRFGGEIKANESIDFDVRILDPKNISQSYTCQTESN